jgi:hypothetical protein
MVDALQALIKVLPPPEHPVGTNADWRLYEGSLGITYPASFKELIATYGACLWFDNYSILYPAPAAAITPDSFLASVRGQLDILREIGVRDPTSGRLRLPLYPEPGGLFPFMADCDGYSYFWRTDGENPDRWPLMQWGEGHIWTLKEATLTEFFLASVEEYRKMGEPERVRVDQ